MGDNLVPFVPGRRRKAKPPPDEVDNGRLHWRSRQAHPEARELAAQQNTTAQHRYLNALERQRREREATDLPVPARITMALDLGGHEGPEVDVACGTFEGNPDGDVDLWECGLASPTAGQVKLLAALTGFPVSYFHKPIKPGPLLGGDGRMWICWTDSRGCQSPEPDLVDEAGVLHYGGERRQPPDWWTRRQPALF
jgi:hypothetical protein